MKTFFELREKTLTPAEKKKREEIARAMERENPNMPMAKKMAIATATAKKVAEEAELDEASYRDIGAQNMMKASRKADKEADKMRAQQAKSSKSKEVKEEAEELDELKKSTLASYVKKASADQYFKGKDTQYHDTKAQQASGPFAKETKKKHYAKASDAERKAANRDTGIGRAVDRLTKEEVEQVDEISRDLARRYIRKVADKTNTGELSTKEVEKRRPGVNLAGKKAYPGIAGTAKVPAK